MPAGWRLFVGHAEDAGGVGGGERDEALRCERPALTPKCQRICRRFSMPGPPLGILVKLSLPSAFCGEAEGAVVGGDDRRVSRPRGRPRGAPGASSRAGAE